VKGLDRFPGKAMTALSYFPSREGDRRHDITVGALLRQIAAEVPDRLALIEAIPGGESKRRWTYRQLLDESEHVARVLRATYGPGEHLAIWAPNCPEWLFLELGAALAGIILVPVNPAFLAREAEYVMRQSQAAGLFLVKEYRGVSKAGSWAEMQVRLPRIRDIVFFEEWHQFSRRPPSTTALPAVDPGDSVMIEYTSGTTGAPKGAVLSHRGVVNIELATRRLGLPDGSVWLNFMPMFHVSGGIYNSIGTIWNRGTQVMTPGFDAAQCLQLIEEEKIAFVMAVPTMILGLLDHPDFPRRNMSSLRAIGSGGTTVPEELVKRIETSFGVTYAMIFGQTETSIPVTHSLPDDSLTNKSQTVGWPIAHTEIKIASTETGEVVPIGEIGEICVRGVGVMKGYFDDPEATRCAIDPQGWLHSGDLGTMDAAGYCRITGRLKDMIIRGGENIFPREIEDVLITHPSVADAAVFGVKDARWGEQPAAAVRLRAGAECSQEELAEFLRAHLARHKVPRFWQFVESFPLTASGKIQKFVLRERLQQSQTSE
jgi:fatty-acyl-CoA synthase